MEPDTTRGRRDGVGGRGEGVVQKGSLVGELQ